MDPIIERRSFLLLAAGAAVVPFHSLAQDAGNAGGGASGEAPVTEPALAAPSPFAPVSASEVVEADLRYVHRPVIIFADSPLDPNFIRQMEILPRMQAEFDRRDVIIITDTDPAAPSALRLRLRPRGFSLVIMDKDWGSAIRKPLPWEGREIINAIDRMPIARTEALERSPAGR